MENLHYVVIFFFVISIIFFILSVINKRDSDEGNASVYLAIGIILLIICVVMFLVMVNVNHLYDQEKQDDIPCKMNGHYSKLIS